MKRGGCFLAKKGIGSTIQVGAGYIKFVPCPECGSVHPHGIATTEQVNEAKLRGAIERPDGL